MTSLVGPAKTCKILLEIQDKTRPLARPLIKSAECYDDKNETEVIRSKREADDSSASSEGEFSLPV